MGFLESAAPATFLVIDKFYLHFFLHMSCTKYVTVTFCKKIYLTYYQPMKWHVYICCWTCGICAIINCLFFFAASEIYTKKNEVICNKLIAFKKIYQQNDYPTYFHVFQLPKQENTKPLYWNSVTDVDLWLLTVGQ